MTQIHLLIQQYREHGESVTQILQQLFFVKYEFCSIPFKDKHGLEAHRRFCVPNSPARLSVK